MIVCTDVANSGNWVRYDLGNPQDPVDCLIATTSTTPTNIDVVYGRGTGFHNSPGNVLYRREVMRRLDDHTSLTKSEKSQLVRDLIETLWSRGVRFLKKDDDGNWQEVNQQKELHRKVSHCFRTLKKARNGNRQARNGYPIAVPV